MNCPSEQTWSVYADGELPRDELRGVEMHLVGCRACRTLVVALRDEATGLSRALQERKPEALHAPRRPRPAPAQGFTLGLPAAVAAVTVVLASVGFLLDTRLPGALDLFNPLHLTGAIEMAFDLIFMMRATVPGLLELAISVGAVAGASALGCVALNSLFRSVAGPASLLILASLWGFAPQSAEALDLRLDSDVHVRAGETIEETLVCTGDNVTIDGVVDGDLFVAAHRVILRGTVTGSFYVFGRDVDISGDVDGTVLGAAEIARLTSRVGGNLTLAGERITLAEGSQSLRDVSLFGDQIRVEGSIDRDLAFAGDWIEVRGAIGRNLQVLGADRVHLMDGARVGGDVSASLWGGEIEVDPGVSIGGEVTSEQTHPVRDHYLAAYKHPELYALLLGIAAAALVLGLLFHMLDPRLFESDPPDARGFMKALGIGFVLLGATPAVLILCALTVVGIPIAMIGAFAMITAVHVAYVMVAALVGRAVMPPSGPGLGAFAASLLVGVLIVTAVVALPFVGIAVRIVVVLFGLGFLFDRARGLHALSVPGLRA